MEKTTSRLALERAIGDYPTLSAFAAALGVRYQVVQQWLANGVPAEYCPEIEKLSMGKSRCEDLNDRIDWAFVRGNGRAPEVNAKTS